MVAGERICEAGVEITTNIRDIVPDEQLVTTKTAEDRLVQWLEEERGRGAR
jgi:hypothetical protein